MTQLQFPESRYAGRLFLCGRPAAGQMLTSSDQVPRLSHSFLQFHVHLRINTVEILSANLFYVLLLTRVERHQELQLLGIFPVIASISCTSAQSNLPP
jgi:hypothetical protein